MGEIANDAIEGFACSWCGIYFKEAHEYPVVCTGCYQTWVEEQKAKGKKCNRKINKQRLLNSCGLQLATIPELG